MLDGPGLYRGGGCDADGRRGAFLGECPATGIAHQLEAARAVGILLTGMGSDGAKGLLTMHNAGAHTIAQHEASSTVFGMPRAAIALGAADVVAPIGRIARHAFRKAA